MNRSTNFTTHMICRDGVFYYHRRVPSDLNSYYSGPKLCFSLRTRSRKAAEKAAKSITNRLDDYWMGIRLQRLEIPALAVVKDTTKPSCETTLSDALALYLRLKGRDKDALFKRTTERAYRYVIECLGDRPINQYSSADAGKLRDYLLDHGLTVVSVKRMFSVVRAVINLSIREFGLECVNAFTGVYMPEQKVTKRRPIPIEDIRNIQKECMQIDDDMRHLIALISDTGMRLSEAAGLRIQDINLDAGIPHIQITPHTGRRLKTSGSQRQTPLVGASLWAAQRVVETITTEFAFPRYCNHERCNSNSASAALNKWLGSYVPDGCVIHSFRHSMRDRLRAIECPKDIIDQIGGWSVSSVGETYGEGYKLELLQVWMRKLSAR